MTLLRTAALALPLSLAPMAGLTQDLTLDTDAERFSYAVGVLFGNQLSGQVADFDVDLGILQSGFAAGIGAMDGQMTLADAQATFQEILPKLQEAQMQAKMAEAEAFMAENAARDDVTVTESGLQYRVVEEGAGDSPTIADTVSVHYTGRLLDGTVFDSSVQRGSPAQFPVSGVIPGWTEALQLMKPGGKLEVWIPSELAYGPRGAGQDIGPNETLTFEMELLEIVSN